MRLHTTIIAKQFIKQYLKEGDFAIDATMGRGNDTKFLCEIVGIKGKVIALDIQKEALKSTKALLEENLNLCNIASLFLDSHENIQKYALKESVDCITFNFGYLPKGNHSICTKPKTSILAIKKSLELIKINGIISLCVYQGGDTGFLEKDAILNFVKTLDPHKYTVCQNEFINRPNYPPVFIGIVKDR